MIAQRIVTTRALPQHNKTLQRDTLRPLTPEAAVVVQRWVCEICGMVHTGNQPHACDGCGVTHALVQQREIRQEISHRC